MAINQQIIDRYKAQGFYKYVEWNRKHGVLIKVYEPENGKRSQRVTFQVGTYDVGYDQTIGECRQFFLDRKEAVNFMLQLGMSVYEIAKTFRNIDGMQEVSKYV
jgi:hypothetical protein